MAHNQDIDTDTLWKERETAETLTCSALNHYAIHRQIVLQKLILAHKSMQERKRERILKKFPSFVRPFVPNFFLRGKEDTTEKLWLDILHHFKSTLVGENDLFRIEELLEKISGDVKERYTGLIGCDKTLKKLTPQLKTDEYRLVKKRIQTVQKAAAPLSPPSDEDSTDKFLSQLKSALFEE